MYSEYFYFGLEKSDQFLSRDTEPTSLSKAVDVAMANIDGAIEVRATAPVRPDGHGSGVEFNQRFLRGELLGLARV